MARSRSAASLSLTIGIAFATLVVATGILAGPSVLDCSQQPQSFGACLRGKAVDSGLLNAGSDFPAVPSSAELEPRAPGWIEANATEYETPAPGVARLSAEPGRLDAMGELPSAEVSAEVALADPGATLDATGLAPAVRSSGDAAMTPTYTGSIDAVGAGGSGNNPAGGNASIAPPLLPPPPEVTGHVGPAARGQGRASLAPQLIADLSPVPPLREIVPAPVPKGPRQVMPPPLAAPKTAAQIEPTAAAKPRPPKFDPRYPNVLVLPPPNTGENSSFATLELR